MREVVEGESGDGEGSYGGRDEMGRKVVGVRGEEVCVGGGRCGWIERS